MRGGRSGRGGSGFPGRNAPFRGRRPWRNLSYFQPWFQPSIWSYWGYPYYAGPGYPWSSLSYPGFPEDEQGGGDQQSADYQQGPPPEEDTLANQVEQLTEEVAALRQQQGEPPAAEQASQPQDSVPEQATVFAYRDGHKIEARNYAIQGETLWVFQDQITRKISLGDLDLGATKQLNDSRGVEFAMPQSR